MVRKEIQSQKIKYDISKKRSQSKYHLCINDFYYMGFSIFCFNLIPRFIFWTSTQENKLLFWELLCLVSYFTHGQAARVRYKTLLYLQHARKSRVGLNKTTTAKSNGHRLRKHREITWSKRCRSLYSLGRHGEVRETAGDLSLLAGQSGE
jgi:hypothetical protein